MKGLPRNVFLLVVVYNNGKTPEEEALHRALGQKLIKRMLAHPEIAPYGKTKEKLLNMLTDGSLDNPRFQHFAFEAETYFEFKDEMALKGINVFNAGIEHVCSSLDVQNDRAQKMIEYLSDHESLLSDNGINRDDLVNPKFIKKGTYFLARAWCFVLQLKLAGIDVALLPTNDENRLMLDNLLNPLIKGKKIGAFQ